MMTIGVVVACLFRCSSGERVLSGTKSSYQFEKEKRAAVVVAVVMLSRWYVNG